MRDLLVADARRIGVVRANQIGDLVFSLPALSALRHAYPAAEMVLLGKPVHAALFDGRPAPVDRVVVMPPIPGVGIDPGTPHDASLIAPFVDRMRAERFDIVVQMHGGGRYSNPFARSLEARVSAGSRAAGAAPLDRTVPFVYWQHEYFRCLEIAGLVGGVPQDVEPRLSVIERDVAASRAVVAGDETPIAVMHPGSTDARRRWPLERFAQVGDALSAAGCRVCIVGAESDASLTDAVRDRMHRPALALGDRLSLSALLGLLSRAAVFVGNDSGPLHLAIAVGTPTVAVFWCGNLVNGGPLTRTRHRPLVSWRLDCPVCGVSCLGEGCAHTSSFVDDVHVDDVLDPALELIEAASEERPPATAARA